MIQTGEDLRRVGCEGRLRAERRLEQRSNQSSGHTVAGYIGHQNADAPFVHDDEVVKVSGDRGHRQIARGNV